MTLLYLYAYFGIGLILDSLINPDSGDANAIKNLFKMMIAWPLFFVIAWALLIIAEVSKRNQRY